jgi:hypothetical protein
MHLLILTHTFPPNFSGSATMQYELAKHMASAGHQVTVVTSYSHHHMSVNTKPLESEELIDGIRVLRVRALNWTGSGFIQRFLEGIIMDIRLVNMGLHCGRPEVVFSCLHLLHYPLWQ